MLKIRAILCTCMAIMLAILSICVAPKVSAVANPVKISQGNLWATKTYVDNFVESPDGSTLLYRYFADPTRQPTSRETGATGCQMWKCNSDGTSQTYLFDIPWKELGHGADAMLWIDNDRFYYNGILYQLSTSSILWQLNNPVNPSVLPRAWSEPVNNKMFVNIRSGTNAGYYWINPYSSTVPVLNPVMNSTSLVPFLGGDPSLYQFTYVKQSPGGSYLYFVIYFNSIEYAFTSNADGTGICALGDTNNTGLPFNGHTVWYDDSHLIYPNLPDNNTEMCDRFGANQTVVAGRSNHVSLSPDKNWIVTDLGSVYARLYKFGSIITDIELMQGLNCGFTDAHPSFSRDGKRVYFMGINGTNSNAVYYADVSQWTQDPLYVSPTSIQYVEAESMTLNNYNILPFVGASGGAMVIPASSPATASFTYTGPTGNNFIINTAYRAQSSGVATFNLYVDGVKIDTWSSAKVGRDNFCNRYTRGVSLTNGQVIKLEGINVTITAKLDYLEIMSY